jgi:hypothetical protein
MARPETVVTVPGIDPRRRLFSAGLMAWGLVGLCVGAILLTQLGDHNQFSRLYLLPWCLATGVVILFPGAYLAAIGRFHPFHPLVLAAWSYFLPGFFIGGLILTFGMGEPYIISLIQDESTALPLTFVYIMLGFGFMTLGFAVSYAKRLGFSISRVFPKWDISTDKVLFPAVILMTLGAANTLAGYALGILGFQHTDQMGIFDGVLYLLSLFLFEGSVLLWLYVFRSSRFGLRQVLTTGVLLAISLTQSALQGSRGALVHEFILIAFAFSFSGRKITAKHYTIGAVCVSLALLVGMIYGTTFRGVKGTRDRISIDEYAAIVPSTMNNLSEQNLSTVFDTGLSSITNRLDSVSSLAVVVSNYEALAPYEEIWGINDNIYVDTVIFFIPRLLWPNKPVPIELSRYGDLYFNYAENSFAMTPMGDLLRNYGPVGVPIGMFVLGFIIRVIYSSLVENQEFSYLRVVLFFMLLSNISFEGTFGLIIPTLFKIGVFAVLGLIVIRLLASSPIKAA